MDILRLLSIVKIHEERQHLDNSNSYVMKRFVYLIFLLFLENQTLNAQGLNFNDSAYNNIPQKRSSLVIKDSLPTKIDLSMYVPNVLNQEQYGTCIGFSTAYYMRTILEAIRHQTTDKNAINAFSFSPSYLYNAVKSPTDLDCSKGTEFELALEYLKKNGVAKLSQQNYPNCTNNGQLTTNTESKILDYIRLFGLTDRQDKIINTKKALAESTPVVVGILTTNSLEQLGKNGFWKILLRNIFRFFGIEIFEEIGLWKPEKSNQMRAGHAVCVVGYDNAKFGGAFKVVNSRGKYWGDDGYFWIRYEDYKKLALNGFQAYLPPKNSNGLIARSAEVSINYPFKIMDEGVLFAKKNPADLDNAEQLVAYSLLYPQRTGTSYKFSANVDSLTYLYVLGANATNLKTNDTTATSKLFPMADSVGAIIGSNTKVLLPSEDNLYTLVEPTGTEFWLFLFSDVSLDIDSYIKNINHGKGSFTARTLTAFGPELVPYQQIDYLTKKIGFTLKGGNKGHIVPLLISLEHIKRGARNTPR